MECIGFGNFRKESAGLWVFLKTKGEVTVSITSR